MKKSIHNIILDWSEIDMFGHINNVMYFKYIQSARVKFWEEVGLMASYREKGLGATLASVGIKFKKELHYPGEVRIETETSFIKTTSFGLKHSLYNLQNELVAEGEDVIVVYDYRTSSKVEIWEELREELEGK